jgi:hypothetical protein
MDLFLDKKSNLIIVLIAIMSIIIIYKWRNNPLFETVSITPNNDIYSYNIQEGYKDKDKAAQLISNMNNKVITLLKFFKEVNEKKIIPIPNFNKYKNYDYIEEIPINNYTKGVINRLLLNWNPEVIYENPHTTTEGTSYTVSKGEKTVFCLRNKSTAKLHEKNDMLFVVLHELSHMGDLNWNHKRSFWEIFKFILIYAEYIGIYKPIDYSKNPMVYCGLKVNYNPYYDKSIKDINF